jgi:hypothetical protein
MLADVKTIALLIEPAVRLDGSLEGTVAHHLGEKATSPGVVISSKKMPYKVGLVRMPERSTWTVSVIGDNGISAEPAQRT